MKKMSKIVANGSFVFQNEFIKKKKITGRTFPLLLGIGKYEKKGDTVLKMVGLLKDDPIDPYYLVRGTLCENRVKKHYEEKGYECQTWNDLEVKKKIGFDLWKDRNESFGGIPDIVSTNIEGTRLLIEVKSKSMKDYETYVKIPNEEEIMQMSLYATLGKTNDNRMFYVFLPPELEQRIKEDMESMNGKAREITDEEWHNCRFIDKKIEIDFAKVKEDMQNAKWYLESCCATRKIALNDLSINALKKMGITDEELDNAFDDDLPY